MEAREKSVKNKLNSQLLTALMGTLAVLMMPTFANSQEDSACFMIDDSGQALDLGKLCPGETPRTLQVPIKRRDAGIPVIDVTFNGRQTFEMLFDTGASGTAITPQMAQLLGVAPEGSALVDTAGGRVKVPIGRVASVATGGIVANNLVVTINPSLPLGLLGQDLFGNYDVTIKKNIVQFHPR